MVDKVCAKFYKKFPKEVLSKLQKLDWNNSGYDDPDMETHIGFFNQYNEFVGAADIILEPEKIVNGLPVINFEIVRFEVDPNKRGNAWGLYMYEYLLKKYRPERIELYSCFPDEDDGESWSWWEYLGFKHEKPGDMYNLHMYINYKR